MNKVELVESIATQAGLTKKQAEAALKATIESITTAVAKGEKVQLVGFGTFEKRERAERICRNPQTQEEITIPACFAPAFKPGKEFKEKVNA